MNNDVKLSLDKLTKALARLQEGLQDCRDELGQDGVIKRFEFTFELAWKTLKRILNQKGSDVSLPRDILKESFRQGYLHHEEVFLQMLDDRNETSHIYSKDKANQIFERIKNDYARELTQLAEFLTTKV